MSFTLQRAKKPMPRGFPTELVTLGDHLRAKRMSQHMLQKELAEVIGVSTSTIENWEINKSQPHYRYNPVISDFLGYCLIVRHPMSGWRQTILNDRLQRGMRRTKYGRLIGIDESTLRKVELGKKVASRVKEKISSFLELSS